LKIENELPQSLTTSNPAPSKRKPYAFLTEEGGNEVDGRSAKALLKGNSPCQGECHECDEGVPVSGGKAVTK